MDDFMELCMTIVDLDIQYGIIRLYVIIFTIE